ncbi:hypothetical protein DVH05_020639 [Phytophthora capsici]|nr:hypothetical protein DVH05_020639 [Phytophthora capsici]
MAGGRPRFGVWKHFNRVEGTKDVTRKKCFELISNAKVEKLDRHVMINCQRWTENDRNAFKLSVELERQPNTSRASVDSSSSGSDSSSTSCRFRGQRPPKRITTPRLKYSDEKQQSAFHEASLFLTAKWDKKIDGGGLAPLEWWSVNRSKYPALFEIARRVFTKPTSSATAERSWSIYKYIHSKLRNQLLSDTVQKLVFIYSNRLSDDKPLK